MRISAPNLILIPYGVDKWSPERIRLAPTSQNGIAFEADFPFALIDRRLREPLRFNNGDYDLSAAPGEVDEEDPFVAILAHTKRLIDPWNRFGNAFLDGYFRTVERLVAENAERIEREKNLTGSIYEARDWLYSAPRPLPRAHLLTLSPGQSGSTESVQVDLAFWTGERIVAIDSSTLQMLPKRARERREKLAEAGVELVETVPGNDAAWDAFLGSVCLREDPHFWSYEALPVGPFRSAALDALI